MISIEGSRVGYLVKPSLRPFKLGDRKSSVERARNNLGPIYFIALEEEKVG